MALKRWEQAAELAGTLHTTGDWYVGALVATWAEPQRPGRKAADAEPTGHRVSIRSFAERSGIDAKTISRYLKAWSLAAKDGIVPPADELTPGWQPVMADIETAATDSDTAIFRPTFRAYVHQVHDAETLKREAAAEKRAEAKGESPAPTPDPVSDEAVDTAIAAIESQMDGSDAESDTVSSTESTALPATKRVVKEGTRADESIREAFDWISDGANVLHETVVRKGRELRPDQRAKAREYLTEAARKIQSAMDELTLIDLEESDVFADATDEWTANQVRTK